MYVIIIVITKGLIRTKHSKLLKRGPIGAVERDRVRSVYDLTISALSALSCSDCGLTFALPPSFILKL